jgi:hypothetical protein
MNPSLAGEAFHTVLDILASSPDWRDTEEPAKKAFAKLKKKAGPEIAPLTALMKQAGTNASALMQGCLELPSDHVLHVAARSRILDGRWKAPVLVSLAARTGLDAQPRRCVSALCVSEDGTRVFAGQQDGVVAVWSTKDGSHVEDWKTGVKVAIERIDVLAGGRVRVVTKAGKVFVRGPGDRAFALLRDLGKPTSEWWTTERWIVFGDTSPDGNEGRIATVQIFDLDDDGADRRLKFPITRIGTVRIAPAHGVVLLVGESWSEEAETEEIDIIRLDDGSLRRIPLPEGQQAVDFAISAESVWVQLHEKIGNESVRTWHRLDLAELVLTRDEPPNQSDRAPLGNGLFARGTRLFDAAGALLVSYEILEDHNTLTTTVDVKNARLLVAGENVKLPVMMLERYGA